MAAGFNPVKKADGIDLSFFWAVALPPGDGPVTLYTSQPRLNFMAAGFNPVKKADGIDLSFFWAVALPLGDGPINF